MKSVKYIGADVHQATTVVAILDAEGKLRESKWVLASL